MLSEDEIRQLLLRVMRKMVAVGWLQSYTHPTRKGFHLTWTARGAERAVCLRRVARAFDLVSDDQRPLAFDQVAHAESVEGSAHGQFGKVDEGLAACWRESVGQLALRGDEDGLLALVHIVDSWGPEDKTRARFGRGE